MIYAVENSAKMAGRPYNLGLDDVRHHATSQTHADVVDGRGLRGWSNVQGLGRFVLLAIDGNGADTIASAVAGLTPFAGEVRVGGAALPEVRIVDLADERRRRTHSGADDGRQRAHVAE